MPVDEHGLCVDALDADAVLVTPAHQFPTGAVLAPERRRALLAWGGIVIEDDYDSEYRYDRAPVGTLQRLAPDRVVYLGTTSKTLAPALRLGLARRRRRTSPARSPASAGRSTPAAPRSTPAPTRACSPPARSTAICAAPAASTANAATGWSRRSRRGCPRCRVTGVAAGLHLLLRLPPGTDEAAVVARLAERRIRIRGLAGYRLTPRPERARTGDRLRPPAARRDRRVRRAAGRRPDAVPTVG